ncbi:MAG: histidine--tRNA ligase [Candidatus Omnitrophica bacterium]|nr:histidine--tRNA ligase [Candidatus Omnitrophota bacterium]
MKYTSVRGMDDILPQHSSTWQEIESKAREIFSSYGYNEIRTPILEKTEVFSRGIGEGTDIVSKEMYTFQDRKGRSLTLRPEGTAPIVRSYIQNSLSQISLDMRLFYIGPMFRSERPQKGRSRQFHQIGSELIGPDSPYADAEIIIQMNKLLKEVGIQDFDMQINSLGCKKDKEMFSQKLKSYLKGKENGLCEDCSRRIDKNVLRVLDCKNDKCKEIVENAPDVSSCYCQECVSHFETMQKLLNKMEVKFRINKKLVRGLDYYTKTVFEVSHKGLGSQDAIGAGGRYNNLVKDLGGPDVGAVGYAIGMERMLLAVVKDMHKKNKKKISLISLGDKAKAQAFQLAEDIRDAFNIPVLCDLRDGSLKTQLRNADKQNVDLVLIIGENEIEKGIILVRDMNSKQQIEVPVDIILDDIKQRITEF